MVYLIQRPVRSRHCPPSPLLTIVILLACVGPKTRIKDLPLRYFLQKFPHLNDSESVQVEAP